MKKRLTGIGLLAIAAVTMSLLVAFIVAQMSTVSPFYIDLRDYPIYVKTGFDPNTTDVSPSGRDDWGGIIGPDDPRVPVVEEALPDEQPPFTTDELFSENDREYTIAIPFEVSDGQMQMLQNTSATIPALYLAGIGDNWQIFLNGSLVDSQMQLDETGTVITHHTRRSYNRELDPTLLRVGENLLTLHIVGSPSSGYTGLFYQSPYYLASHDYIVSQTVDYVTLIFCTVYVLMGLYHLLLFSLRLNDRYNFFFGLFSICTGIYFMTRSPVIHMLIEDWAIIQRLEYASLFVLPFLVAAFLELIDVGRIRVPTRIYGVLCVLLIAAESLFSLQFADNILEFWQILLVAVFVYLIGYDLLFRFFWRTHGIWVRAREAKRPRKYLNIVKKDLIRTPLGNFFLVTLLVLATAIYDLLDAIIFHTGITLTRYSFFIFTILSAIVLARHFASSFNQADDLNAQLEKIVQERTRELAEQVTVAQQASRAKSQFLATMSHEIRTPLNAIIGLSDIELHKPLPPQTQQHIEQIRGSGTTLLSIINDILDISKIETGNFEIVSVEYHLASVINDAAQINIVRIGDKPIRLVLDVDPELPTSLYGDDLRFKQILNNVLSNGIKYTNEGEVRMRVEAAKSGRKGLALIRVIVSDSGVGIKPEDIGRLFDEYSQLDAQANRKVEGTGLGLSITRRLLEMMGGSIRVQSVYGEGSTFTIELPQPIVDPTPLGVEHANKLKDLHFDIEEKSPVLKLERKWLPHGRVLTVDDVPVNIAVVEGLLEPYGIEVDSAHGGREAVEKVCAVTGVSEAEGDDAVIVEADPSTAGTAGKPYDLIFMDHMMPEVDGIEATRRIRALDSDYARTVPIVALTANALTGNEDMFLANGFTGFIPKPINIEQLDDAINRWIKDPPTTDTELP
jgi:signal transduction histidine kinase/CheY-like chemotaxis protein